MPDLQNYENPTEEQECQALHQWLTLKKIPHHHIANESRSGRYGAVRGAKLKKMGQSKGFPDYCIVLPNEHPATIMERLAEDSMVCGAVDKKTGAPIYFEVLDKLDKPVVDGKEKYKRLLIRRVPLFREPDSILIFIEMKRKKGGVLSPEQKEWLGVLTSCGIECAVCHGFDEAKTFIERRI